MRKSWAIMNQTKREKFSLIQLTVDNFPDVGAVHVDRVDLSLLNVAVEEQASRMIERQTNHIAHLVGCKQTTTTR